MKTAGVLLILAGLGASVAIYMYDIAIKHEPSVTLGPRSGPALGAAVLILIVGIILAASAGGKAAAGKPPSGKGGSASS
jgi:hypothetical protein